MSIAVPFEDLPGEVAARSWCYLISTRDDGRPHVVALRPMLDGAFVVDVGARTRANVTARPLVTLVWPPAETGGYSLVVDGTATVNVGASDATTVTITPTHAVLHRPA